MRIKMILENNKLTLIFNNKEEAYFFYTLLNTIKTIKTETIYSPMTIKLDLSLIDKYKKYLKMKVTEQTLEEYVRYLLKFARCSNNIISPDTIIDCIKNKHYANALRNYLHMLSYYSMISRETYKELLSRIPKFSDSNYIANDYVPLTRIINSIKKARSLKYYDIYIALLYSGGIRLAQLLLSLNSKVIPINHDYSKLMVPTKGTKTGLYAYLPNWLLNNLKQTRIMAKPKSITRYFTLNKLVGSSNLRSFCWQTAKQILGESLALLLQGRLGELKKFTTARHYDLLIFQLDKRYVEWKEFVDRLIKASYSNTVRTYAKEIIDDYELVIPL